MAKKNKGRSHPKVVVRHEDEPGGSKEGKKKKKHKEPTTRKWATDTHTETTSTSTPRNADAAALVPAGGGGLMDSSIGRSVATYGGAAVGGAATVVIAEKFGLSPKWAGGLTGAGALALAAIVKEPTARMALLAAGLGGAAVVGTQFALDWHAKKPSKPAAHHESAPKKETRQADEPPRYITPDDLNAAMVQMAQANAEAQKQATCDLATALGDTIRRVATVVRTGNDTRPLHVAPDNQARQPASDNRAQPHDTQHAPPTPKQPSIPMMPMPRYHLDERNAAEGDDDYMASAYGHHVERNADDDTARNAEGDDDYMASAYGHHVERNAAEAEIVEQPAAA